MKNNKVWKILLCCNLLILIPSLLYELARCSIINAMNFFAISSITGSWFGINMIYGMFFSIPTMIIICISTLIIIKKEHKKGNIIKQNLFIWLILWVLNVIAILCSFDLGMFIARQ